MAQKQGVPVTVNPTLLENQEASSSLGMDIKVGPDEGVILSKMKKQALT